MGAACHVVTAAGDLNLCLPTAAAAGWNGLLDPVEPGLACGSDTAHLSILGYNPRRCRDYDAQLTLGDTRSDPDRCIYQHHASTA